MRNTLTFQPAERKYAIGKSESAHCMLRSVAVGFDTLKKGQTVACPQPYLNTLAIEMTVSGSAWLCYADRQVKHRPRSLMLMLPGLEFQEVVEELWSSCWFVLWGPLADCFVKSMAHRSQAVLLKDIPADVHLSMLQACRLMLDQPPNWQWPWLSDLTRVLDYVQKNVSWAGQGPSSLLSRTDGIMERYFNAPISMAQIAEKLNMSLSSFSHQFRKESGSSPALAFRQKRIDKAKQLLIDGLTVTETSETMGFENPFHFSRVFKQIERISPSEFKQQANALSLRVDGNT